MKTRSAKRNFGRYNLATLVAVTALMVLGMAGTVMAQCVATADGSGLQVQTLYAGQTIEAGTVSVEVVGEDLVVSYETIDGWELAEAHLWVGADLKNMPQNRKGSPKIGNFPYHASNDSSFFPGDAYYAFSIPLNVLGFSCPSDDTNYFVAAHAELQKVDAGGNVIQTETGWADGDRFVEKGMWGTFATVTLTCNCDNGGGGGGEGQCETAFAYGGGTNAVDGDNTNSFLDIDEDNDGTGDFNRWGWSNGPLGAGTYTFDIYAGAGQSDINKGTLVGTLTVVYDGSSATVTYDMGAGFTMDETHLYVGSEILPRNNGLFTVAPGQYGNIHDLTDAVSDTFVISGLSGDIYVVAHGVVCGAY